MDLETDINEARIWNGQKEGFENRIVGVVEQDSCQLEQTRCAPSVFSQ